MMWISRNLPALFVESLVTFAWKGPLTSEHNHCTLNPSGSVPHNHYPLQFPVLSPQASICYDLRFESSLGTSLPPWRTHAMRSISWFRILRLFYQLMDALIPPILLAIPMSISVGKPTPTRDIAPGDFRKNFPLCRAINTTASGSDWHTQNLSGSTGHRSLDAYSNTGTRAPAAFRSALRTRGHRRRISTSDVVVA